jgi:hypothetical protein
MNIHISFWPCAEHQPRINNRLSWLLGNLQSGTPFPVLEYLQETWEHMAGTSTFNILSASVTSGLDNLAKWYYPLPQPTWVAGTHDIAYPHCGLVSSLGEFMEALTMTREHILTFH